MDLSSSLAMESCSMDFTPRERSGVFSGLASLIAVSPMAAGVPEERIRLGLEERESMGSTGFGNGIAIPHCKVEGMNGFAMALAVSRKGVDFDSMDGRDVHIFCVIVGPPGDPEEHLRLLAVGSRVLGSGKSRHELLSSASTYALREAFLYHAAPATALSGKKESDYDRLLMIVIQEEETYNEILELFLEMGLPGAISHEGVLMGEALSGAPVFAGFLDVLGRSKPEPRTIFALVPGSSLDEVVSSIEEITGNLDNHRGACIIVLTPELVRGSLETL